MEITKERSVHSEVSNAGQRQNRIWPWKLTWKIKIPLKVPCFAWLVCRRACLTHEVLQKKGRQICSRCFMCDQEAEVNGHLFLHCKVATNLWNMFFCILGVCWVTPQTTKGLLDSWKEIGRRH
ncbi:hypothetical protein MTR67_047333 [Solanum verrucosum]|uniref:Reverse transcriptase zinc-binding domain-containing protein n=1 Tax=Solanum verrucosum TaxID=315347 RepID=A0AAF0UVQ0_SOLVR|nr:hypothetical protein MTR67_047333 [Solanum verrucosum]